jgi:hypothetical protein
MGCLLFYQHQGFVEGGSVFRYVESGNSHGIATKGRRIELQLKIAKGIVALYLCGYAYGAVSDTALYGTPVYTKQNKQIAPTQRVCLIVWIHGIGYRCR